MLPIAPAIVAGVFDLGRDLINKLIKDPEANAAAQLKLMELDQQGELAKLQLQMSAILAEANSSDPWTSRARPSFMYLFYFLVMFMVVAAPLLGVWYPEKMEIFFLNVNRGFVAIPSELWWVFSVCFTGYSASKTYESVKKVPNPGK
jgi:hypothetical protein